MDVRRPPRVVMIAPRVRAGMDRGEAVLAAGVGEDAAGAREIRIERGAALIPVVAIPPPGVGLPDLDERVRHRPAVVFEHSTDDVNLLADRLSTDARVSRQVRIARPDSVGPEDGPAELSEFR